ncbi:hypothetical protein [Sulfurovum sp.]|jgi:hypothetical protein|uniref:hypothetical protein n=1 Tax=Sulfurovum sp. TaxID=1969726 RepID=UPI002A36DEA1|nr:hypothetical protein [Sulfurovum sp.]MDY0403998.1 hypothetical protein [Sulfurovum sp.]
MKKLLMLATIVGFLIGSNGYAASPMTVQEDKILSAIQKGAQKDGWIEYTPSEKCAIQRLYFKKRLKNHQYHAYRYQNRDRNSYTTVYAQVAYSKSGFDVQFVDKVSMNLGKLGSDSSLDKSLDELREAIDLELSARS